MPKSKADDPLISKPKSTKRSRNERSSAKAGFKAKEEQKTIKMPRMQQDDSDDNILIEKVDDNVENLPSPFMTAEEMRRFMNIYTESGFCGKNKTLNRIEKYLQWYGKFLNAYDSSKCLEENFLFISQSLLAGGNRNESISQRYDFVYALSICAAIHRNKLYDFSWDALDQLKQTVSEMKELKLKEENDLPSYFEYEKHLKQFNQTVLGELLREADEVVADEYIVLPERVLKIFKKLSLVICWRLCHENNCSSDIIYNLRTEHIKAGLEAPIVNHFVFPYYHLCNINNCVAGGVRQYEKPLKILCKLRDMLKMDEAEGDVATFFFRSPRETLSAELLRQFDVEEKFRKIRYDGIIPGLNGRWWEFPSGYNLMQADAKKRYAIAEYIRLRKSVNKDYLNTDMNESDND